MWDLGDEGELARRLRTAAPFPHIVCDDIIPDLDLFAILDEEDVAPYEGDILRFDATAPEPSAPEFRALRAAFAADLAPVLSRITGKHVTRVDMRAFAYRAGHYLLPHTDHQDGLDRVLAYAYYLATPEPPVGGELELYAVDRDDISSVRLIEPRPHRLVVFEVGDRSLHQVREVVAGVRLSLAGWFYA